MAVTLTGTSSGDQGLFNRLGRIGYVLNLINSHRGTDLPTEIEDVIEYFDGANTTLRATVEGLISDMVDQQDAMSGLPSALQGAAENIVISMFDADAPLASKDIRTALEALKKQMSTATTTYVAANTVTATYTGTSLTGTGNVVLSVKDGRGVNLENLLAERIRLRCIDNTTNGSEVIEARGEVSETDKTSHRWPLGSGCLKSYVSCDATLETNLVTNGTFEAFTVSAPDDWSIITGAGTITHEDSTIYSGAHALKITGDGSTLTQIRQALTGLESLTPYAINFYCRNSSNPSAGVLTVDLYDGSAVIADEAGTNNSFTVDLTTLGTTYVAKSGVFRLPEPLPATVYLRVRVSTAIENTKILYVDHMAMQAMEQPGGDNGATPFMSVFSGAVGWSTDDGLPTLTNTFKIETSNDYASAPTQNWNRLLDQLLDTASFGFTLPTSGTTLISHTLIG